MKKKYLLVLLFCLALMPIQYLYATPHTIKMPKEGESFAIEKLPKEYISFYSINLFRYDFNNKHAFNKEGRIILSWKDGCDTIQLKESTAPYTFIRPNQTKFKKGEVKIRIETEGYEPFETVTKIRVPFNLVVLMKPRE